MKETIFSNALLQISSGVPFEIKFCPELSLKVGDNYLVEDGVPCSDLPWYEYDDSDISAAINLNDLYQEYKFSIPGKHNPNKPYFKALKSEELSADDMLYGRPREIERFRLEFYLLYLIVSGNIKPIIDECGSYFWQSQDDKDFVILRKWIEK